MSPDSPSPHGLAIDKELLLSRKTFMFGYNYLKSVSSSARFQEIMSKTQAQFGDVDELDVYWLRELAAFSQSALEYSDFLPGRHYTYRRMAEVVDGLNATGGNVLEAGSGSAITSVLASCDRYLAVDLSVGAHCFARYLNPSPTLDCIRGDIRRLPVATNSAAVAFSLGTLEHLDFRQQVQSLEEQLRVAPRVIICVPNESSPIYRTMAALERATAGDEFEFPLEKVHHEVDVERLSLVTGASIVNRGGIHIPPPTDIAIETLDPGSVAFFHRAHQHARKAVTLGLSPSDAWARVEARIEDEELHMYAWFRYHVLERGRR